MSKRSGEQARRDMLSALRYHPVRYRQMCDARDKMRLTHVLRQAANRLEAEAKGTYARLDVPIPALGVGVTDHAVCRFLERVMRIDVEAIRAQIARAIPLARMPAGTKGMDNHSIHLRDGFQFLLSPNSIVSVLTAEMDGSDWLTPDEVNALAEGS